MSIINQNLLLTPEGYTISRSVRLRSSASPTFTRTPTVNGDSTKFTLSCWIKRTDLSINTGLMTCYIDPNNFFSFGYNSNQLWVFMQTGGVWRAQVGTTAVFRDPSSWYHVVMSLDTSGTVGAGTYLKIYINGVLQTLTTSVAPNGTPFTGMNSTSYQMQIGRTYAGGYSDQYLAEYYWIDGQVVAASAFGETDGATGVWKPKKYLGTYGTNGFYLNFSDNSAATAAAIGKDSSGNGNNWTPNNISVTAGVTYDSMLDVPTPYADGGNGRGNYAVLNPVNPTANTPSDGNLRAVVSTTENGIASTIAIPSGLNAYWEVVSTNTTSASIGCYVGVASLGVNMAQSASYNKTGVWAMIAVNLRQLYANGAAGSSVASTLANTSILQVAVDNTSSGSNTYIWIGVDNVWYNSTMGTTGNPSTGANPTFTIAKQDLNAFFSGYQNTFNVNFGQRPFTYTPPTGFKALNTQNLPDSTIKKGNQYFDATLYTGNGTTTTISSLNFQPDLVWQKNRSSIANHILVDSVRGGSLYLIPNSTGADASAPGYMTFNSNGESFTSSDIATNQNGQTYVAWQWKESVAAGFDIVTYTGNGASSRAIAHSLGVAPAFQIVKNRTNGTANWLARNKSMAQGYTVYLNLTNAQDSGSSQWGASSPDSSNFYVGFQTGATGSNNNGDTYVAYLFAEVAGFSKFGSYTGNGSADGPFVYCGFRPRFIMQKKTSDTGEWIIWDTSRLGYNYEGPFLMAQSSAAESASAEYLDILSNGFKWRTSNPTLNVNGGTNIFMAFAENPFKNSLAR